METESGKVQSQTTAADIEITERIAKAINESAYAPHEESWAKDRWRDFLPAAKRVLIAMFEPTHAMYMHGGNAEPYNRAQSGRMRGRRIGDLPARDAWRLMIDRALGELKDV